MLTNRPTSPIDSLYSPILINPLPAHAAGNTSPLPVTRAPRLKYPYPLTFLALFDVVYSATSSPRPAVHLLVLSVLRGLVLSVVLGGSVRWRSRGGWVGGSSVLSLGSVVWEVCKGQLVQSGRHEGGEGDKAVPGVITSFLVVTGILSVFEYLTFLLLLRLSPPAHRFQPFGLRVPPSAIQSPTTFAYSESPASFAHRRLHGHRRHESVASRLRFQEEVEYERPETQASSRTHSHSQSSTEDVQAAGSAPSANEGSDQEADFEFDDSRSISTISDSSIIDLPPPLEPNRLIPPSVSLNTGLSLAALDQSPVIGPLVRRTRSARFMNIGGLGRGPTGEAGEAGEREREASNGYGTFGMA